MVGYLLLLLTAYSNALNTLTCIDVKCSSKETGQCIEVSLDKVLVRECPSGYVCESYSQLKDYKEIWEDVNCTTAPYEPSLCDGTDFDTNIKTGLYCCTYPNCNSGICTDDRCVGYSIGHACYSNEDCTPEAYCKGFDATHSGTCTKISSNGTCTVDVDCNIGYGCNLGTCTKIFSQDYNSKVSDKKFCITDFATTGYCDAITVWSQNIQLSSPFKCHIGYMCEYRSLIYGTVLDQQLCLCSGDGSETGYCGLNMVYERNHAEDLYKDMEYSKSYCAGSNARTDNVETLYNCGSISEDEYDRYVKLKEKFDYWTLYQSGAIDDCAEDLELFKNSFSYSLIMSAVLLAVSILN